LSESKPTRSAISFWLKGLGELQVASDPIARDALPFLICPRRRLPSTV